jgi:hypothetical protein
LTYFHPQEFIAGDVTVIVALPSYLSIGLVRYIDYGRQGFGRINMYEWPMHKRLHYIDDKELRVLADTKIPDDAGFELRKQLYEGGEGTSYKQVCIPPVDLGILIEGIHLHPESDEAFMVKATAFCHANDLPEPRRSELADIGSF